jgi:hypothetical protein
LSHGFLLLRESGTETKGFDIPAVSQTVEGRRCNHLARLGNPTALQANHFWRGNSEAVKTTGQKMSVIIACGKAFVKQPVTN